jgi:hypothetical protein
MTELVHELEDTHANKAVRGFGRAWCIAVGRCVRQSTTFFLQARCRLRRHFNIPSGAASVVQQTWMSGRHRLPTVKALTRPV